MCGLDESKYLWPDFVSFTAEERDRWDKNLKALVKRVEAKAPLGPSSYDSDEEKDEE
jgi:hypothetical protein